jgi:diamine N-acetyltransferase
LVENFEQPVVLGRCSLCHLTVEAAQPLSVALAEMDPWLTLGYQSEGLFRYLTRSDAGLARYAVFATGELSGIVCVRHPWLCGANLELFAILPGFQGAGMGAELMDWLTEEARLLGSNLWTTVSSFNTAAQRFYARCGFETVVRIEDLVKPGYDELLLRRRLKAAAASDSVRG